MDYNAHKQHAYGQRQGKWPVTRFRRNLLDTDPLLFPFPAFLLESLSARLTLLMP